MHTGSSGVSIAGVGQATDEVLANLIGPQVLVVTVGRVGGNGGLNLGVAGVRHTNIAPLIASLVCHGQIGQRVVVRVLVLDALGCAAHLVGNRVPGARVVVVQANLQTMYTDLIKMYNYNVIRCSQG